MLFRKDRDLVEIMRAVEEIAVDICSNYTYLRPEERNEKLPYLDDLIVSYVDKYRYSNNQLPDHVFFVQTIDSYVDWAFRDKNPFFSKTINDLMKKLVFERLDTYKAQLRRRYPVEVLEAVA